MTESTPADAAYQGQPGAFSEQAARRMCGADATLLPCETLADAFAAVAEGRARSAVVPIENTLAGPVPGVLRLLLASVFVVTGEVVEWIDHVLAAPPGASLDTIREVLSHPVALAQCTAFFKAHPRLRAVPAFDTAGAVQMVMRDADPTRAALGGRSAAALYGASIIAEHLQDHQSNYTRFVRVAHPPLRPAPAGPARVMLAARLAHRPGTLAAALQALAAAGANLTRIDSAPVPGCPFEYEFFLEGTFDEASAIDAAVSALDGIARLRTLGLFDVPPASS